MVEPPINRYMGYTDQTITLQTAFENVVNANQDTVRAMQDGMAGDYRELLNRLKSVVGNAHEKYARAGKLNYQELTRYNRIRALEEEVNAAIRDSYSPIRRRVIHDQKMIVEKTYTATIDAFNNVVGVNVNPEISGARIADILNKPWSGVSMNERLYLRQQYLGVQIRGQILRDTMGEGATYSESMKNLKNIITKDYAGMGKTVEDIAHQTQSDTEQTALNRLSEENIQITKTWVSAGDDRVREAHELLDGQTVDAQDMFEIPSGLYTGFQADGPGLFGVPELDINCRCYLVADIREKQE